MGSATFKTSDLAKYEVDPPKFKDLTAALKKKLKAKELEVEGGKDGKTIKVTVSDPDMLPNDIKKGLR